MSKVQSPQRIRKAAEELDAAIETGNIESVVPFFSENCEIEFSQIKITGRDGVRKWLSWIFSNVKKIKFEPVTIMVSSDTFFEEFKVEAELHNGKRVISCQSEVLVYENYKVKSLRLYFDRLDFAEPFIKNKIARLILNRVIKKSLEGLI